MSDILTFTENHKNKYEKDLLYKISGILDIHSLLQFLIEEIDKIVEAEYKLVYLNVKENLKLYQISFTEEIEKTVESLKKVIEGIEIPLTEKNLEQLCFLENKILCFYNRIAKKDYIQGLKLRFEDKKFKSTIFIPILLENKAIGVLSLYSNVEKISIDKANTIKDYLFLFSKQIKTCLQIEWMQSITASAELSVEKNEKIIRLLSEVNLLSDQNTIFEHFMKKLLDTFGFDTAAIQLKIDNMLPIISTTWRTDKYEKFIKAAENHYKIPKNVHEIRLEEGACSIAFMNNIHLYFEDINLVRHLSMSEKDKKGLEFADAFHPNELKSMLIMPLTERSQPIGVLQLWSFEKNIKLSQMDIEIIRNACFFISTTIKNADLYLQIKEKNKIIEAKNQQMHKDLNLAKRIQQNLMPHVPPPFSGIQISTYYKPMEEVGGDFFDFIKIREPNILGIFISDISGHGIPAALVTCMLKALIETSGTHKLSPASFLSFLNEKIFGLTDGNFITAFFSIYNALTKKLIYARGSHNYPYLIRDKKIIELESRGKMLGLFLDLTFEEKEIQLQENDKLIFFTDGLTEAVNIYQKEFCEVLSEILILHSEQPIGQLTDIIRKELFTHRGKNDFDDDICIVGLEIK